MSNIHGRNSFIALFDDAGASADLSGDANNTTWTWSRDNPDVTTYGKDSIQRIAGLRDATLTVAGIWNDAAGASTATACVVRGLMAGSLNSYVRFAPAKVTACPLFCACMLVNSYEENSPVNNVVTFTFSAQLGSGSVTASTF